MSLSHIMVCVCICVFGFYLISYVLFDGVKCVPCARSARTHTLPLTSAHMQHKSAISGAEMITESDEGLGGVSINIRPSLRQHHVPDKAPVLVCRVK